MYYYLLNAQGDVVGLIDSTGALVVQYTYDAWGRLLSITYPTDDTTSSLYSTLGVNNPLRYRGYVYDTETGLYYLQSRYYNPTWGRFINADDPGYMGVDGTPSSYNLFAYCCNNPVVRLDSAGTAFETIFDVLSFGASLLEVVFNPADPFAWMGLAGDAVDLIPFVSCVGETIRGLKIGADVADGADNTIDTYRALRKINKGTDVEVHHIVEKRFSDLLGYGRTGSRMPSVALSKGKHKQFTNRWRERLPYGLAHDDKSILHAAIKIYADEPELLGAAIYTLYRAK